MITYIGLDGKRHGITEEEAARIRTFSDVRYVIILPKRRTPSPSVVEINLENPRAYFTGVSPEEYERREQEARKYSIQLAQEQKETKNLICRVTGLAFAVVTSIALAIIF